MVLNNTRLTACENIGNDTLSGRLFPSSHYTETKFDGLVIATHAETQIPSLIQYEMKNTKVKCFSSHTSSTLSHLLCISKLGKYNLVYQLAQ